MKVKEAIKLLEGMNPDSDVTLEFNFNPFIKVEKPTPVPVIPPSPYWIDPYFPNPYTITCSTVQ